MVDLKEVFMNILLKIINICAISIMVSSCARLKRVDKSYTNNLSMNLDQGRTPAFAGRGMVLNGNNVGSNTACTTCSR